MATFTGFEPGALRLLAGLRRHNDRAWFAPRKERFERELLAPMAALCDDATAALHKAKIPIGGDRKRSMFRIYRDIRFRADKTPFRTNVAAYLSYDGGRDTQGGIYIHIEPGRSYLSLAFYNTPPPMLVRWRRAMAGRPAQFRRIVATLEKRGLAIEQPEEWDDSLVRMPRGFEEFASHELAPYFRLRHFCARRKLTEKEVGSAALVAAVVKMAKDCKPLLEFGWSQI